MNAKLVNDHGIIKISVNGETLDAVGYMTYNPDGGQFPKFEATAIGSPVTILTILSPTAENFGSISQIGMTALRH